VALDIPQAPYNSRFTFSDVTGKVELAENGRQKIDKELPALLHVSQTVYAGMARWAGSILNSKGGD